jgi:hypothetical protein
MNASVARTRALSLLLLCLAFHVTAARPASAVIDVSVPSEVVADSTVDLVWVNDTYPGGTFVIHYTTDSVTWHLIGAMPIAQGEQRYAWKVPRDLTDRAYVKLTYYGDVVGMSNRFSIVGRGTPSIDIVAPYPSNVLYSGTRIAVTWWLRYPEEFVAPIVVEYAQRPGSSWQTIGETAPRSGFDSLIWTVPDDTTSSGQIRVRSADGAVSDTTRAWFRIRAQPSLRLIRPVGGESFAIDSVVMIVWEAWSVNGHYTVEYTTDSGAFWYAILGRHDAREGVDSIAWSVPSPPASSVRVRIRHEEGTLADTSDPFAIVAVASGIEAIAERLESGAYPNPSRGETTIAWSQHRAGRATIDIVDITGTLVARLDAGARPAGRNEQRLELGALPQGHYRFVIEIAGSGAVRPTGELSIVR